MRPSLGLVAALLLASSQEGPSSVGVAVLVEAAVMDTAQQRAMHVSTASYCSRHLASKRKLTDRSDAPWFSTYLRPFDCGDDAWTAHEYDRWLTLGKSGTEWKSPADALCRRV